MILENSFRHKLVTRNKKPGLNEGGIIELSLQLAMFLKYILPYGSPSTDIDTALSVVTCEENMEIDFVMNEVVLQTTNSRGSKMNDFLAIRYQPDLMPHWFGSRPSVVKVMAAILSHRIIVIVSHPKIEIISQTRYDDYTRVVTYTTRGLDRLDLKITRS